MKQESFIMKQHDSKRFFISTTSRVFLIFSGGSGTHALAICRKPILPFATGVRTFYLFFFTCRGLSSCRAIWQRAFLTKEYKAEKLLSFAWLYLLFKDAIELVHFHLLSDHIFETAHHPSVWTLIVLLFCGGIWLLSFAYSKSALFRKAFILGVLIFSLLKINMLTVGAAPWYLLSLIWWHIFLYLTKNMKPKYVLIGAVLLAAVIHYQEPVGKFLSLSRTIHFLPFFLMGYYIKKEQFQAVINNAKCRKALPAVLLLSACMLIPYGRGVQKYLGVFFFGIAPYAQLKSQLFPFAPLICILWMAAVVLMLFGLFILCPKKETFLCQFGKNTIGIYILHRLFKDFLIYGGFYELLSANGYLAVLEIMVVSLLLTFLFGTAFWADIIKKLSRVSVRKLYS